MTRWLTSIPAQHDKENDPSMHEMYCIFHFIEPVKGIYLCSVGNLCFNMNTHFSVQCSSHITIIGNVAWALIWHISLSSMWQHMVIMITPTKDLHINISGTNEMTTCPHTIWRYTSLHQTSQSHSKKLGVAPHNRSKKLGTTPHDEGPYKSINARS